MCRLIPSPLEVLSPGFLRSRGNRLGDIAPSLFQQSILLLFRSARVRCGLIVFLGLLTISKSVAAQTPDEIVVAVVDGQKITQKQVDDSMRLQIHPLTQQLATIRRVALENLITTRVLENEAKRRRISLDELRKELTAGEINITEKQVEDAYTQNSSFFAAMSPEEAKARLRLDLENQVRIHSYKKALEKLRQASSIRLTSPANDATTNFDDSKSPWVGSKDASVTIVEFSDFECPFCNTVQPTLKQILHSYDGQIKLIFKHLPSEGHKHSLLAARAAVCAAEQDRFWQYHDILFAATDRSPANLRKIASNLGLGIDQFQSCLTSEQSLTQVVRDLDLARSLRINSTPSFVVNGRIVSGALSLVEFRRIIEQELEKAKSLRRLSIN